MKNNFVKKGDWVRVCYAGVISKTLFKVACRKSLDAIIIEIDSIKNKEDRRNICGWFGDHAVGWKYYGLSSEKMYWIVGEWERINNKLRI